MIEIDYFHDASDMLTELIRMRHVTRDEHAEEYATIVSEALQLKNKKKK